MTALNLGLLLPEGTALAVLLALVIGEITSRDFVRKYALKLSFVGLFALLFSILVMSGRMASAFAGMFLVDSLSIFFKALFVVTFAVVLQMGYEFFGPMPTRTGVGEFYMVLWVTLIGLFFMVSSNDFLVLFVSLEIVALSFYVLASYLKGQLISIEAGLKYLVLGSLASAFFLFGVSLLYVGTGATALAAVRLAFIARPEDPLLLLGMIFVVAGIGFKIASVPFHLWVPDVYEGAPTPIVAFLSVGSKAAGFAVLLRILFTVFGEEGTHRALFSVLSVVTMLYGNLGALLQSNIKRLFGYSSIGHAGYLMVGLAAGKIAGTSAVLYYLLAYAVSNLAAFLVLGIVGRNIQNDHIEGYRGLAKRSPFLAACLFVALLSLAGVPPLAGFFAKFLVLLAAVREGLAGLALIGALTVAVSLYYYLSIVRKMYFEEPSSEKALEVIPASRFFLIVLVAAIFVIGLWQAPFLKIATMAAGSLF